MAIGAYLGAALIVGGFAFLLLRLGLVARARLVNGLVRRSVATLADRSLSDGEKERSLQAASIALFGEFARITLGLLFALGVPVGLVWLIAQTGAWGFDEAIAASLSWQFIGFGTLLFIGTSALGWRRGPG